MTPITEDYTEDDPRVLEAAREYLAELEAGSKPNRQTYLARYPELAQELAECFDGIELAQTLRPPASPPSAEFPASPLGDFQIVREVGRGGMGIVYEAVQLSLGRRVALKVLPFAAALDAKHLQRFKTEAHAAAQLHHTNIVPVYAVGCERGVHFYAMQLIEGQSLDQVIDELRGEDNAAPASGSNGSTVNLQGYLTTSRGRSAGAAQRSTSKRSRESYRTAARIAAQAADALEYAHDAGVIHRDIKPANLLLDAKGAVWVTDFGLAHVTANASLTQTGDQVGTLRYMSPEQASGQRAQVDHRTDVYSLGATLYEFLTLQPLFPGHDRQTLLQQILFEEPRPLRQLNRSIPVELETIVLKALAKTPAERYGTAAELAADLRRFLDERPILARRPSPVDRARKWMRRHPSFVAAAVVLLVFVSVVLAGTTALIAHEQALTKTAYDLERQAYDLERQRAQEAEERFRLAQRAAYEMIRIAEEGLADDPLQENLLKQLLETALAYYQEFIELRSADPNAQADLEITRAHVQRILKDLALLQGDRQIFLLRVPAVLNDLRASFEQRTGLNQLIKRLDGQRADAFRDFHRLTTNERRQRSVDLARSNEAAIATLLSPEQLRRLRQVALQCQGLRAFREPEVAKELKLTAEQKERIRSIEAEGFRHGPPPSRGPKEQGAKEQAFKVALEKIQALLTEEQSKRWKELTGEPVAGLLPMLFPERGGPPPRRPH